MSQKINTEKKVVYVALNFATGISDLTLEVRKPDGSVFSFESTEGDFSEQGQGIYIAEYIPDTVGLWQEKVTSVINGDKAIRSYEVTSYKVDDIQSQVDGVETKVDNITSKTDNLPANTSQELTDIDTQLGNIETKVDNISIETNPGGHFA